MRHEPARDPRLQASDLAGARSETPVPGAPPQPDPQPPTPDPGPPEPPRPDPGPPEPQPPLDPPEPEPPTPEMAGLAVS